MSHSNSAKPPSGNDDDLISRLYDVALDPSRYEELLDQWEAAMGPLRRDAYDREFGFLEDARLAEHVKRADAFLDKIDPGGPDELEAVLSHFDRVAALAIDAGLTIPAMNGGARSNPEFSNAEKLSDLSIDPQDLEALGDQVRRMLSADSARPSVFRVRSRDLDRFMVFHLRVFHLKTRAPVAVAVTSQLRWPDGFGSILADAFDLTGAETDVIRQLIDCASVKEIAERRGRSVDTVRAQLKSILAKTEAKSQVELVRLVLSMMDIAGLAEEKESGPTLLNCGFSKLEPRSFRTIFARDGRRVDYLVLGDPAGRPVLYFHLDYGLSRWPAAAENWATVRGLKIVVPIRAGYGKSDPIPWSEDFTACTIEDVRAVLETENAGPCPALSIGSDVYYAFHLERAFPGTLTAIIACAAVLPLSRPEQYERMDKFYRFILAGARYTPKLLPFMVKAGFHLARKNGKRAFLYSVFGKSAADVRTFEDPEVFEALITGSEVALSAAHSAHDAFARQVVIQETTDWRPVVNAARNGPPVICFNGLQDPQIPPDTLREFQQEYPWMDWIIDPDSGQLIFFRDWSTILEKLSGYVK